MTTVFNKRNALVGYVTLQRLKRRRKRKNASKIVLLVALGLVSAGILAGVGAVLYRRHGSEVEVEIDIRDDSEEEIVGEYVTAGPEPIPAT